MSQTQAHSHLVHFGVNRSDISYWMIVVGAVCIALALIFFIFALVNGQHEIIVHQPKPTVHQV